MKNILRFSTALVLVPAPFAIRKTAHVDRDDTIKDKTKVVETLKQNDCILVSDVDENF
jgi:hypothetical protein